MLPDVIIIGDSHTTALKAGCDAHGIRAETLRFSGNFWHAGYVQAHRRHGIWFRGMAGPQQQILDLRDRLEGRSLIGPDVPILASVAFNLGRIVPPFGFNRHVTHAEAFGADPDSHFASQALVDAYVEAVRAPHIAMAQRMSRFGNMTLVVPPHIENRTNYETFSDAVSRRLRSAGVRLFDPRDELCGAGQALGAEYLSSDGMHGNERYGAEVVGLLLAQGLLAKRAA